MKKLILATILALLTTYPLSAHLNYTVDLSDTGIKFHSAQPLKRLLSSGGYVESFDYQQRSTMSDWDLKALIESRLSAEGVSGVSLVHVSLSLRFDLNSSQSSRRITFFGAGNTWFEVIQSDESDVPAVMYLRDVSLTNNTEASYQIPSTGGTFAIYDNNYTPAPLTSFVEREISMREISWITVDRTQSVNGGIYIKFSPNTGMGTRTLSIYSKQSSLPIYITQHPNRIFNLVYEEPEIFLPGDKVNIALSGSVSGVWYTLYKLLPDNTEQSVRTSSGSGYTLDFGIVDQPGTYFIKSSAGERMNGTAHLSYPNIFTPKIICNTGQINLDGDGGIIILECTKSSAVAPTTLSMTLAKYNSDDIPLAFWNPPTKINVVSETATSIKFEIIYPPNLGSQKIFKPGFIFAANNAQLEFRQPTGSLKKYTLAENYEDSSFHRYDICLDGSQPYVSYRLMSVGVTLQQLSGSGNPVTFSGLSGSREYSVQASFSGRSETMNNSLDMTQPNQMQSNKKNWLSSTTFLAEGASKPVKDVTYYDGFGNPIQIINVEAGGNNGSPKSIITPIYYDPVGRQTLSYLPFASLSSSGWFENNQYSKHKAYYRSYFADDCDHAFSENILENSPLGRIKGHFHPGSAFRQSGNDKLSSVDYEANSSGEVIYFKVDGAGMSASLMSPRFYGAGTLHKSVTVNEDGCEVHTFTDISDKTLLERVINRSVQGGTENLDTYYVYDDHDRLVCVVSPEGSKNIAVGRTYKFAEDNVVSRYCYVYVYDHRDRCELKRLPGADWIYMVYDRVDRLVMTQDGNMRSDGKNNWMLNTYDALGRPVKTEQVAFADSTYNHGSLKEQYGATASTINFTAPKSLVSEFLYDSYPADNDTVLVNHFDEEFDTRLKGLKTFEKIAVLDDGTGPSQYVERTFYYDTKGRIILTVEKNHLGGVSSYSTKYDFVGNILESYESHQTSSTAVPDAKLSVFTYDPRGRLLSETTTLNGGAAAEIRYGYDDLGRLKTKTYGTGAKAITENYAYNIQGWLTDKTSDVFDMRLRYYDPQKPSTEASYTGNITEWEWSHRGADADSTLNTYAFSYDKSSRLTDTERYVGNSATPVSSFTERNITYDRNGNMLTIKRYQNDSSIPEEEIVFTAYNGNQIDSIACNGSFYDYSYDANGNMIFDGRNALNLNYNYLNLTSTVADTTDNVLASYRWLADGTKAGVKNAADTSGYEYTGSLVYKRVGGELRLESADFGGGLILVSEGSAGTVYTPAYYITDHLGSTRAIYDGSETIARSDFLPFGTRWDNGQAATSRYQFTGYEDQELIDRKYMDAGARFYNGIIFNNPDPLSEKNPRLTPYAYCANNPLLYIDPTGMEHFHMSDGRYVGKLGESEAIRIIRDDYDYDAARALYRKGDYGALMFISMALGEFVENRIEQKENDKSIIEQGLKAGTISDDSAFDQGKSDNWESVLAFAAVACLVDGPIPVGDIGAGLAIVGHFFGGGVRKVKIKADNPKQYKRISDNELQQMKKRGFEPHNDKPNQGNSGGKIDYYKDKNGNIYFKTQRGNHYEPVGSNVKQYK